MCSVQSLSTVTTSYLSSSGCSLGGFLGGDVVVNSLKLPSTWSKIIVSRSPERSKVMEMLQRLEEEDSQLSEDGKTEDSDTPSLDERLAGLDLGWSGC